MSRSLLTWTRLLHREGSRTILTHPQGPTSQAKFWACVLNALQSSRLYLLIRESGMIGYPWNRLVSDTIQANVTRANHGRPLYHPSTASIRKIYTNVKEEMLL